MFWFVFQGLLAHGLVSGIHVLHIHTTDSVRQFQVSTRTVDVTLLVLIT